MNYFPNGDDEISLVKFIAEYQYLNVNDAKYFFNSNSYYRKRIKHLVDKRLLKRIKYNLVLGELGIDYVKMFNFNYNRLNRNKKYSERLVRVSSIGAFYYNSKNTKFTPSFSIKDRTIFTITGRRFIGIFNINGIEYMCYQISKEHDSRYIASIIYDMQKEKKFKNFIILIDDINRVNINDFSCGSNQVIFVEDTEKNRMMLNYLNNINWKRLIENNFKPSVVLSEYTFCDYTDYKDKYISTFFFLDAEKINRIKYFLNEHENKNAIIICSSSIENQMKKYIPTAKYIPLELDNYIDKEIRYYD